MTRDMMHTRLLHYRLFIKFYILIDLFMCNGIIIAFIGVFHSRANSFGIVYVYWFSDSEVTIGNRNLDLHDQLDSKFQVLCDTVFKF